MKDTTKPIIVGIIAGAILATLTHMRVYEAGYEAAQVDHVCPPTKVYELTVRTDKFSSDLVKCETLTVECSKPDGSWFRHDFAETKTSYYAPTCKEKNDENNEGN